MTNLRPHIAPAGLGPLHNQLNGIIKFWFLYMSSKVILITGPNPIPALTCPDTAELELPSNHSYSYCSQSSPTPSHISPASVSGMLV